MRNPFFIPVFFLLSIQIYGQKEDLNYKKNIQKFERIYNSGQYDSLFFLFSPEMQKEMPSDKTTIFLSSTKSIAGKLLTTNFEGYESTYASYKAQFERRVYSLYLSLNSNHKINGFLIEPYAPSNLPKLKRNISKLALPFHDRWTVLWGGDTKALNYHVEVPVQKGAFDFLITDSAGKAFKTDGQTNEDYYAFGKDLFASCDGEVVLAVEGVKDNVPGKVNTMFVTGNTVMIKTIKGEYLLYAHFKQHSIAVQQGQMVKQGQYLGQCGNSGNSTQPHLHFHIQNVEDMNSATGAKAYFDKIVVDGVYKTDYSPIKDQRVQNQEP